MDWVFGAVVGAAVVHIFEEYVYPGGFSDVLKRLNPKSAHLVTPGFNVIVNGLFLLLCVTGAIVGRKNLVFSLSVASLLFVNASMHIQGTIRAKRYYPGVISGMLLYMPLSIYAYYLFATSRQLTLLEGILSGLLGILYMAVPVTYIVFPRAVMRE